jgi:heterodisulfide reductase subunit D
VGRALIIELYRGEKSAFTKAAVDRLYQCNLCGACKAWCKPSHELPRIIELAREQVVKEHRAPQGILDLDLNVTQQSNVYNEPHSARFNKLPASLRKLKTDANAIYFVGCTTAYRHPEIAMATSHVLTQLGISLQLLTGSKGEVCCGSPLIRAGFTKTAKILAQQNVDAINQTGIRTVIATCPGCARSLKLDYPKLGVSLPKNIRVYHITEYLTKFRRNLASQLEIPWKTKKAQTPAVITYHDPCHLGRELGVYKPPRQLLKLIPGVKFVEFYHNREFTDCCGGGGVLPKTFPDLSKEVTERRLADTANLDASYLISACPNCKLHFTDTQVTNNQDSPMILDIMELLAKGIKKRSREK